MSGETCLAWHAFDACRLSLRLDDHVHHYNYHYCYYIDITDYYVQWFLHYIDIMIIIIVIIVVITVINHAGAGVQSER